MKSDILRIAKVLLNEKDTASDSLLMVYIDMTIQSILTYCNISELPEQLVYTTAQMVADEYRVNSQDSVGEVAGAVTSISEDGRTISFATSRIESRIKDRIGSLSEINKFKKMFKYV